MTTFFEVCGWLVWSAGVLAALAIVSFVVSKHAAMGWHRGTFLAKGKNDVQ